MQKTYVTVNAYDQFAQDVTIGFDREKAIDEAKEQVRKNDWDPTYPVGSEEIWPNNEATPGNSALIYHVQKMADECEEYISVFEVVLEEELPKELIEKAMDAISESQKLIKKAMDTIGKVGI